MALTSWLRMLSPRRAPRARAQHRPAPRFRPAVETLENRVALSTLTVTTTVDVVNPSDGVLSLREAVATAKNGDTIAFSSLGGPITLNGSELLLDKNLTITGLPGAAVTITGSGASRVFEVAAKAHVHLDFLTISDGLAFYDGSDSSSIFGGGVLNYGTLTVSNCTLTGNRADSGGGIYNAFYATLTLTDSTLAGNSTQFLGSGGGIHNAAGATLKVSGSTLADNTAGTEGGGGIYNFGGTVTVTDSILTGNVAFYSGGGIHNAGNGSLTVSDSVLTGNQVHVWGGGIVNWTGTATVKGCTLTGNSADFGGGLFNAGSAAVTDSMFAHNSATYFGGAIDNAATMAVRTTSFECNSANQGGGIANLYGANMTVNNSSFIGNFAFDVTFSNGSVAFGKGGAIVNAYDLAVNDSIFIGNSATPGGAIYNNAPVDTAVLTLRGCSFSDNTATESGGGIYNAGAATVSGSCLAGNSADADGGAIFDGSTASLAIRDSTLLGNSAGSDGGDLYNAGLLVIKNSGIGDLFNV